ncbi:hypothetical protein Tco_1463017, partial [Tanacetum coccineum]
ITEYLVNISKRHAFSSLNEDILKITILKTNTLYPSKKIRRICACTYQRLQRNEDQYAVTDISQRDKNKAKRTKPNTGSEEHKKTKPKAYLSLMGQPVPVWWVRCLIGQKDVEDDLRAQKNDLEFVINQELGLEAG